MNVPSQSAISSPAVPRSGPSAGSPRSGTQVSVPAIVPRSSPTSIGTSQSKIWCALRVLHLRRGALGHLVGAVVVPLEAPGARDQLPARLLGEVRRHLDVAERSSLR